MKKQDVINTLASESGITKVQAKAAYEALVATMSAMLKEHGQVTLPGVVTVKRVLRAERKGRNPATGEAMTIPAKTVVKAKAMHPLNQV